MIDENNDTFREVNWLTRVKPELSPEGLTLTLLAIPGRYQKSLKIPAVPFSRDLPTLGSSPHLLHCRWILCLWATRKAPIKYGTLPWKKRILQYLRVKGDLKDFQSEMDKTFFKASWELTEKNKSGGKENQIRVLLEERQEMMKQMRVWLEDWKKWRVSRTKSEVLAA